MSGHRAETFNTILDASVPELFIGVVIARLHLSGFNRWTKPAMIIGCVGLVAALFIDYELHYRSWRAVWVGLPAALFIYGTLSFKRTLGKGEKIFGDASFVLYLLHIPAYLVIGFSAGVLLS